MQGADKTDWIRHYLFHHVGDYFESIGVVFVEEFGEFCWVVELLE